MKILIINTSEKSGGAARAANTLHKGLRAKGIDSYMLVQKKRLMMNVFSAQYQIFFSEA